MKKLRFNSPVILVFFAICMVVRLISVLTNGGSDTLLFSTYASSFSDPLTYLRLLLHVFGHGSWSHLLNNMMYLLILGPMCEEKYGRNFLLLVILSVAVTTGLFHNLFFPHTALLGASGVVFALIIICSVTNVREGEIPITLVLVSVLYLGQQIYEGVTVSDNISQLTHILGGLVGGGIALLYRRKGQ